MLDFVFDGFDFKHSLKGKRIYLSTFYRMEFGRVLLVIYRISEEYRIIRI